MTDQNKKETIFEAEQKYGEKIRPIVIRSFIVKV